VRAPKWFDMLRKGSGMDDHARGVKKAQALLELFEQDCGRAADTLDEVGRWACAQDRGLLQLRMQRHLLGLLVAEPDCGEPQQPEGVAAGFRRPMRGWRGLQRRRTDRRRAGNPAT
jgi:hypothetical protein